MGETTLSVKLVSTTASAVQEIKKFSDALHESVTAADQAGGATKSQGKALAELRREQLIATEAARKAADQQRLLNDTTRVFGVNSKEAAAASRKATQAQEESTRAAAKAAASFQKLTAQVLETAKAEGDNLTPATKRALNELDKMGKVAERTAVDIQRVELASKSASSGTTKLASGLTAINVAAGTLIAGGVSRAMQGIGDAMAFSVKSAVAMESNMADVAKVVDGLKTPAGEATVAYHEMEASLFALSERVAIAPEGFAKITAAAGQAGIASEELLSFTENAAKVAVAFDITADAAGDGLAKVKTGLDLSQPALMNLAGTMNHLSNAMASSAPELLDAVQRVGSIGKAANVSGEEIAALASAMISAGAGSEMAATGTKNFLLALAAGESATLHQREAYKALGLDAETVAKNVTSQDMIVRANQMKEVVAKLSSLADDKRISTLKQLFGSETVGTIGPLATNLGLLTQSLELAADKTAAASSVQAEFETRSNTTANTLQLLKNSLSVTAITIGNELLPEIGAMAKDLSAWVSKNRELIKDNVIGFVHGVADAVKGLAPYVIGAGKALGTMVEMFGGVERSIGPVVTGLGALRLASTLALGPWGVLAAGIVAGAVAISEAMADAEKRSMSLIRVAMRMKDTGLVGAGLSNATPEDLMRMKEENNLLKEKNRVIQSDMRGKSPAAIAKAEAERKADMVSIVERGKMIDAALATKIKELEVTVKTGKEARAQAEVEKTRADRLRLELDYLNSIDKLSASQAKRKRALEKVGVEASESSAPKPKGGGKGKGKAKPAEKDPNIFAADLMSFDADVANYAAKETKRIREEDIASQQAAFDEHGRMFDENNLRFDREMELLEARGLAEEDAQAARESLIDRRLDAEQRLADEQMRLAKTAEQREKAQTKIEDIEHRKRVVQEKRASEETAKVAQKKAAIQEKLAGLVQDLSSTMVDAAWAAAEGEKGAGLMALAEFAKSVSKKYTLIGLSETAAAVVAAAGVVTAPLAAGHVAAAAMAFGVAAAAGGAAVGLGAAAKSVASTGKGADAPKDDSGFTPAGAGGGGYGGDPGGAGSGKQLDAQDVPVSFYDGSTAGAAANGAGTTYVIHIQGGTWIGKGSADETAQDIRKLLEQGKGAGKR